MSLTVDRIVARHAAARAKRRTVPRECWTVVLVAVGLWGPAALGRACLDGCALPNVTAGLAVTTDVRVTVRFHLQVGPQVRETVRIFGRHLSVSE